MEVGGVLDPTQEKWVLFSPELGERRPITALSSKLVSDGPTRAPRSFPARSTVMRFVA